MIASGTMAARASSFWTVLGSKLAAALPEAEAAPEGPVSEAFVQAVKANAPTASTVATFIAGLLRSEGEICIFLPFVAGGMRNEADL